MRIVLTSEVFLMQSTVSLGDLVTNSIRLNELMISVVFFLRKIRNIHRELDPSFAGVESVRKLIASAPTKSCAINSLPISVVWECLDELSPAISSSVNLSLEQGHFPDAWKGALVKPKLNKSNLELDQKNNQPLSNLQF